MSTERTAKDSKKSILDKFALDYEFDMSWSDARKSSLKPIKMPGIR